MNKHAKGPLMNVPAGPRNATDLGENRPRTQTSSPLFAPRPGILLACNPVNTMSHLTLTKTLTRALDTRRQSRSKCEMVGLLDVITPSTPSVLCLRSERETAWYVLILSELLSPFRLIS
jgi:hypothetical protein